MLNFIYLDPKIHDEPLQRKPGTGTQQLRGQGGGVLIDYKTERSYDSGAFYEIFTLQAVTRNS